MLAKIFPSINSSINIEYIGQSNSTSLIKNTNNNNNNNSNIIQRYGTLKKYHNDNINYVESNIDNVYNDTFLTEKIKTNKIFNFC